MSNGLVIFDSEANYIDFTAKQRQIYGIWYTAILTKWSLRHVLGYKKTINPNLIDLAD